eukprot:gnl/MRDRNA2_/MRDRNA2_92142_c0_seq1.p1 gnl/MRDRNA2_/MRDRNA2_92142_c0~~gnl/MRDRNA2_/MRDRNA2_92142_c0_seq1.p1  ORF type:complete len:859 (-),score=189.25 gnl/MRDRNA2_/MRDRNA2_92142_c0_seq1:92-2668(-)
MARRAMTAMALEDDDEPYFGKAPEDPKQSSYGLSSTSQSGFPNNSTLNMSSTSFTGNSTTQTNLPVANSSTAPQKSPLPGANSSTALQQKSLNVPLPTVEPVELDQDNKDAPGGDGPDLKVSDDASGVLPLASSHTGNFGASQAKGKALRAKSLLDDEMAEEQLMMPPNPTRNLQMEIEDLHQQKRDLYRENKELRSRISGSNASCPSRALPMHANNVERSMMRNFHGSLCAGVTLERQEALSAELQEAINTVTDGSQPVQDCAFAAMAPSELTNHARLVQPRLNWVLTQLHQFLEASGFQVELQIPQISQRDGVDTCFLGDTLRACFVLSVSSLEEVYAAALLLARAPVMARSGTRWVGLVDRFMSQDLDACSDFCFSVAIDGHIAEICVCTDKFASPDLGGDKWLRRAADAEALLMGAIENMSLSGETETPHSAAAISALSRLTEVKPVSDKHGLQAIHYAALHGNLPLVEKLIQLGADPFATDNEGCLPLHRAVMRRHVNVVLWLLDHMLPGAGKIQLDLVAKRKLVELWQWAIHAGGPEGHIIEGLPTVAWSTVQKLLQLSKSLGADTIDLTERGRNAHDYVAEFGDPVFLETVQRELGIESKAYATDIGCAVGIRTGYRGLLLTMPVRRIDWSGIKSMGREKPLSDFAGYLSRNRTLEELVMWECALELPAASALFSALSINCGLLRLDLMRNPGIGSEDAMKVLGAALRSNQTLKELVLRDCAISAAGVSVLCAGLAENQSITKLNLRENKAIGSPEGMFSIGTCLSQNSILQELDLWECGITQDSVPWLYNGLATNQGLKMLALVGNRGLGQHAAMEALQKCLEQNSTLQSLLISGCSVKPGTIHDPRIVL